MVSFFFLLFYVQDEWVVCKVHHKGGEEASSKKTAAGEEQHSSAAGTPNVSSVEVGEDGDEFLVDSLLDYSSYFNSAAPPYNADCCYPVHTTAATGMTTTTPTTTTSSCFVGLPTDASNSQHAATVANSAAAAATNNNDSSSWNMLRHAPDQQAMGTNYSLQHQAMVAKALGGGGVATTNFGAGLPAGSSVAAATGIAQHSSQNVLLQQRLAGYYGGNYAGGYHTSK
jgi:hypothetical protein